MGLISWLKEKFGGAPVPLGDSGELTAEYAELVADIYIREMAFWSAVNLVANAVSKCEFKTFLNGKETKGREYYLWNLEPNRNQNSSVFIHKWIAQLFRKNEALIIENNNQLLVADDFVKTPYALYDDKFTQVTVGDFTFQRSFVQSEVLYFKLSECDMRKVTAGLYNSYSKLIAYSMKSYKKSRGSRGVLNVSTLAQGKSNFQETFKALMEKRFKDFFNSDTAVLPLFDGYSYEDLGSKTYSSESTRDIRAMINDIFDFTAKSIGIPPALMSGDVQDTSKAVDQLLTFCVDPLVDMLQEEINRKRSGYDGFSKGTYVQIDTKTMKHVDLLSVSTAIDKLIASGAFCVNDIRELVGEPLIDEPWAYEHFITKNYMPFEEALKSLEGGENT